MVVELGLLVCDLGPEELVLGLAREKCAGAHRERPRGRLRQPADQHGGAGDVRSGEAGDDREGHQKTVLEAEHELADPGQACDPVAFGEHTSTQGLAGFGVWAAGSPALWHPCRGYRRCHSVSLPGQIAARIRRDSGSGVVKTRSSTDARRTDPGRHEGRYLWFRRSFAKPGMRTRRTPDVAVEVGGRLAADVTKPGKEAAMTRNMGAFDRGVRARGGPVGVTLGLRSTRPQPALAAPR